MPIPLPLYSVLPFVTMLLAIARAPKHRRRPQRPLAGRGGRCGGLAARAPARARHHWAGRDLTLAHAPADPPGQPVHRAADGGRGGALPRRLPHHDPHARIAQRARRRAGRPRAVAVLLGGRRALVVPRQRAHLPRVPRPGPGTRPARGGGRRAPRDPGRHQHRRGRDGGQHLHRQRAQLHGEGHRGGGRGAHAGLPRLHDLQRRGADPALRRSHAAVLLRRAGSPAGWRGAGRSAASCPRSSSDPCRRAWPRW